MVIKEVDDKTPIINELKKLLKNPKIYPKKKDQIKFELYKLQQGWKNEKEAAYYINTYYKDSEKVAVLHDIRLDINGITVQIDHLLIFRTEVIVFESKYFSSSLYYDWKNKAFSIKTAKGFVGIQDPIKQAERQTINLQRILKDIKLYDMLPSEYKFYVLVSPSVNFKGRMPKGILKADKFIDQFRYEDENIGFMEGVTRLTRFIKHGFGKIVFVAEQLKELHQPLDVSFYLKKLKLDWLYS
ncbi:nuclease-like protein [Hydrogenivirga caldilitoris]|uniref:Nuclease-like protein n=1 Tax=Hydrogenivirga caldilitoris TaxID=246264 RepID=A0A497XLN3_9AQUI|nr:nuclease-related domain-containing protein [Hydrogenivirga caldilitoris]RLJ69777.1 nuclease-like protein [Hydrogenivirga caldilitoris]